MTNDRATVGVSHEGGMDNVEIAHGMVLDAGHVNVSVSGPWYGHVVTNNATIGTRIGQCSPPFGSHVLAIHVDGVNVRPMSRVLIIIITAVDGTFIVLWSEHGRQVGIVGIVVVGGTLMAVCSGGQLPIGLAYCPACMWL